MKTLTFPRLKKQFLLLIALFIACGCFAQTAPAEKENLPYAKTKDEIILKEAIAIPEENTQQKDSQKNSYKITDKNQKQEERKKTPDNEDAVLQSYINNKDRNCKMQLKDDQTKDVDDKKLERTKADDVKSEPKK